MINAEKTDKEGYNDLYKDNLSGLDNIRTCDDYIREYESTRIGPYYKSGNTKGYVRGLAISQLFDDIKSKKQHFDDITILDAGFGQGELSVYLACLGFNVIGIDISAEAKDCAQKLASNVGVSAKCDFHAESLEKTTLKDSSVDYVIGHASLHHFIKYDGVPIEFKRVMKKGAKGYFADSFGENRLYHIFHNKEKMKRLGDVILTKQLIESYFEGFNVLIKPTDWFVMLDKLFLKIVPAPFKKTARYLSRVYNFFDRKIENSSRLFLFLSGSVVTQITYLDD